MWQPRSSALTEVLDATINLLTPVAEFAETITVVKRLNPLSRHNSRETLAGVLGDVAGTLLADFAASVQQDFQVVRATLDPP